MFKYFHHFSRLAAHSNHIWPCQGLWLHKNGLKRNAFFTQFDFYFIMFDLSLCASRFLASFWLHSIRNYLQIASNFSFRSRANLFMQNKINFNAKPEIVWNLAFFLANLIIIKQTEQFGFVYGLNNNNKIPAKKNVFKACSIQLWIWNKNKFSYIQ